MIRFIFAVLLCLITTPYSLAQSPTCTGSLGDNIFLLGDFASGSANNLPNDPNYAPGYRYTSVGPPPDGSYIITNNMGRWGGLYPSWLPIGDNSADPQGYMMVVNADFNPGLFYQQTITNLCEATLYEFSADVINVVSRRTGGHIKPNVSFLLNDSVYLSTGEIPQDEQWHRFGFTFTTQPGQTSLTLALRNNAPGGFGNDLALDNISFQACGPEAIITPEVLTRTCEDVAQRVPMVATVLNSPYDQTELQWQLSQDSGLTWTDIPGATTDTFYHTNPSSGLYLYRFLLANGKANLSNPRCRVNSRPTPVRVDPKFYAYSDTICQGNGYPQGNSVYTRTGVYTDSLISTVGCDSIVTLNLTVLPQPTIEPQIEITDPTCFDANDGQVRIPSVAGGYPPYRFQFEQYDVINTEVLFSSIPAGAFKLLITDRYGCAYQGLVRLDPPTPLEVSIGDDWEVKLGESVQVDVMANDELARTIWRLGDSIICRDLCTFLDLLPFQSDSLILVATAPSGCQATDTLLITVNPAPRPVFVPSGFSPNGDGINDVLAVYGPTPLFQTYSLSIYNRWGIQVYRGDDLLPNEPTAGWDGRGEGTILREGVYVYVVQARFLDGLVRTYRGTVTLLR